MVDEDALTALVRSRLAMAAPDAVQAMADDVRRARGPGVAAILAYGSSLRGADPRDTLIDLYVLTDRAEAISASRASRAACALLPPNVYFAEAAHDDITLRAKCAVVPLDVFERKVGPRTDNPYFWARFAQPSALVYARDATVGPRVERAVATAVSRMVAEGRMLAGAEAEPLAMWVRVLSQTYGTELRSEREGRARQIVAADEEWYRAVVRLAEPAPATRPPRWPRRRAVGKLLSVLRLVKAGFTFSGGADYLAWKIERHSGVPVALTDWQRRHPILASLTLVPKLYRSGAIR